MKKFGETIRTIRIQKGYTLQQLSDGILSISFLSKFERGDSDISVSYFFQILDRLSFTYDEFLYVLNDYEQDNFDIFFDKAEQAYTNRDVPQLKILKKSELDKWKASNIITYRCNTVMLEVFMCILQNERITAAEKDLEFLFDYLFKVEVWGYYELRLYNSTMLLMPPEMVITLSKTAYEKSERFRGLKKINSLIIPILLNTLTYLLGPRKYLEEYAIFLSYLEHISISETDLYSRNYLLHMKGIHEIKIGNRKKGIEMINKVISIYYSLDSIGLAIETEKYLQIILADTKNL